MPTSAGASSAPSKPSASGHFAAYSGGIVPLATSGPITAGSCTYEQAVDNAYLSGGDTSVHGYWLKVSGTCPSTATVTVYLQAYYCDPFYGCAWETLSSDQADVYAGGGSGKWAVARWTCAGTQTVGWRGFVDVDLDGVSDPSGYTYSPPQNLACYP